MEKAKLVLEDGSEFTGIPFGTRKAVSGEVVFNTGMTGYPESLTDPSYKGQILAMTYPLIGNYGIFQEQREDNLLVNFESDSIQVNALVLSDLSRNFSHCQSVISLEEWMKQHGIPGLYNVDTRSLTKKLRENGTMPGKIVFEDLDTEIEDPNKTDLVSSVSIRKPVLFRKNGSKKIVIIDCGVKNSIIRAFLKRDISVLLCPHDHDFLNEQIDGVVISNGPGDPEMCKRTIENVKKAMEKCLPILGICLGSQILGLASGAETYKLKYGHRSHNQPCAESGTKRCYITSQNHGYAVDSNTLKEDWREWFYNMNDGSNEGIIHISKPFFGTQFHPEASPGPDDTEFVFDMFTRALK
ncbi:MAG: glutamine-hydrolyzing carbamoyl-phosphate synthase small subunit [Candidatus Coatesbacteria bacterium]|nr:glutamine-hydrolyzing carbamoyl-phosphate synthase small subunit [Candidatus Coatesbacteria bacterium]